MKLTSENCNIPTDLAREAIDAGKELRIVVDSPSMTTRAMVGDRYVFVAVEKEICKGDIVLAKAGTISLTHRVIKVDTDKGVLLKGDARFGFDGYIKPASIIAVCDKIEIGEERYIDLCQRGQRTRARLVANLSLFYGKLHNWLMLMNRQSARYVFLPSYLIYRLIINIIYPRFRRRH